MNEHYHNLLRPLVSSVLAWLCCGATGMAEFNAQTFPPPVGAGIVATLQADQAVYTNQPAAWWCPPCVTNSPPCMLPCYLTKEETAVARFSFQVANEYRLTRTFIFFSGQQFDVEIMDQTGRVVVAWSDGKLFTQSLTALSLDPSQTTTFTADVPLKDREGQQLDGTYEVRAFLTTSGPLPRVEASSRIAVTLAP